MIAQLDPLYIRIRPQKALVRLISHFFFQGRFLTTKHRWLNHFIFAEFSIIRQIPHNKSVIKPIFIAGIGRSGSTILGKVLSMHREIGFLNEPKAIWYYVDPQDDVNGHFTTDAAQYYFSKDDITLDKIKTAHRLFSFYLTLTHSKRVLDKNPEIIYRIPYVIELFPDAKFIFLVRNGWDTVHSIAEWSRTHAVNHNGNLENWWGLNLRKWNLMVEQLIPIEPLLSPYQDEIRNLQRQEDMAAVEWILAMRQGLRSAYHYPENIFQVPYENLTNLPGETMKSIIEFCDLSDDETMIEYARKVLKSNPKKQPLEIPGFIQKAFYETMSDLNYPA